MANKFYLGKVCKRGHEYEQTGGSLRLKSNRKCTVCNTEQSRAWGKEHPEQVRENDRKWVQENLERRRETRRVSARKHSDTQRKWRREHSEQDREYNSKWRQENAEHMRELVYAWRQEHPEQVSKTNRSYQHKRRATKKACLNTHPAPEDIQEIYEYFQHSCGYCGKSDCKLTLDHFMPINKQGAHALWNLLPACKSCNSSKRDKHPWSWYLNYKHFSTDRWMKIQTALSIGELKEINQIVGKQ